MYSILNACMAPHEAAEAVFVDPLTSALGRRDSVFVSQRPRGAFRECLGCEAMNEYSVAGAQRGATSPEAGGDELHAEEKSGFLQRCCWRDGRAMELRLSEGQDGPELLTYRKPCGCPVSCDLVCPLLALRGPCCCFLPELTGVLPDGTEINHSRYICDQYLCVPKFAYVEDGQEVFRLRPATCCCGCCTACGCCRPSVPFFFHDPATMERITDGIDEEESQPQIRKVWSGMRKECCTTADNFSVIFPRGCDAKRKAGLLGLTFLLDFTVFERQAEASILG